MRATAGTTTPPGRGSPTPWSKLGAATARTPAAGSLGGGGGGGGGRVRGGSQGGLELSPPSPAIPQRAPATPRTPHALALPPNTLSPTHILPPTPTLPPTRPDPPTPIHSHPNTHLPPSARACRPHTPRRQRSRAPPAARASQLGLAQRPAGSGTSESRPSVPPPPRRRPPARAAGAPAPLRVCGGWGGGGGRVGEARERVECGWTRPPQAVLSPPPPSTLAGAHRPRHNASSSPAPQGWTCHCLARQQCR